MENRRQTYRHSFGPQELLQAELHRPGQLVVVPCEVLNLSLGGMRARFRDRFASFDSGVPLMVRLLGRDAHAPVVLNLSVPCQIVFQVQRGEEWHCGFRFLSSAEARVNDHIERVLSSFLLSEQRRRRLKDAG